MTSPIYIYGVLSSPTGALVPIRRLSAIFAALCCVKILIGPSVSRPPPKNLKPNASFIFFARGDPFRAGVFPQWIWYVFVMLSARFPDSIFCPFVRAFVRAFVRLSRVRGFRWLDLFVSVYVCNIPPVCVDIVRLHIRTRIYIRQHIIHSYFVVSKTICIQCIMVFYYSI